VRGRRRCYHSFGWGCWRYSQRLRRRCSNGRFLQLVRGGERLLLLVQPWLMRGHHHQLPSRLLGGWQQQWRVVPPVGLTLWLVRQQLATPERRHRLFRLQYSGVLMPGSLSARGSFFGQLVMPRLGLQVWVLWDLFVSPRRRHRLQAVRGIDARPNSGTNSGTTSGLLHRQRCTSG
jgi:hypothetical protein